ncbi:MAG TPA: cytochrome d ubiquinol oxidase subunit II, partial [Planctomycetota bacterium]|nr:cytochrome d ubiquinol oxidase subunit II [Planctomycetota bacterium]
RFAEHPWGYVFPSIAAFGFAIAVRMRRQKRDPAAFLGSTVFLIGMLTSVAFSLFPYVLPGTTDASRGLTVHNSASSESSLRTALLWWIPGMLPVLGYFFFVNRKFAGKIDPSEHGY